MNRLLSLILCSGAILLTVPVIAEARPPREIRSFNPGVHRSFPSRSSNYIPIPRSCYDCVYSTPYQRGYHRGYRERGYRQGYDRGYDRRYGNYDRYPRSRGRSRIRIEYEGSF